MRCESAGAHVRLCRPHVPVRPHAARRRGTHAPRPAGPRGRLRGDLRAPRLGRLLARLPDLRHAQPRRGRDPGGLPLDLARRRALRPRARQRAHVGARRRPSPGDRRAAPQPRPRPPSRERRGHGGALLRPRAHRRRGRAPRGGRHRARRARRAPRRAAPGDRARLLRRLHPQRDRRDARDAHRHRQGPHAPRPREAALRLEPRG